MKRRQVILGDANVFSRRWSVWVNSWAASPLVSRGMRKWMYRRAGVATETHKIEPGCYFHTSFVDIGEGTLLNNGVHVENVAQVSIGARVSIGVHTVVLTSNHEIGTPEARAGDWRRDPVVIEDGCWIGARSTILGGVRIGRGCVIAAGSVVTRDCEPDGLYGGVPAKRLRDLDRP